MTTLTYPDPYHPRDHNRTTRSVRLIDPDYGGPHRTGYRQPRPLPPAAPTDWQRNPWWPRVTTSRWERTSTPRPPRLFTASPGGAMDLYEIADRVGIRPAATHTWCRRRHIHPCGVDGRRLLYPARAIRAALLEHR